jgi:hypothetical protein
MKKVVLRRKVTAGCGESLPLARLFLTTKIAVQGFKRDFWGMISHESQ